MCGCGCNGSNRPGSCGEAAVGDRDEAERMEEHEPAPVETTRARPSARSDADLFWADLMGLPRR